MQTGNRTILMLAVITGIVRAAYRAPDSAAAVDSALYDSIVSTYSVGPCCNSTIKECIDRPGCTLGRRLSEFVAFISKMNMPYDTCIDRLDKRHGGLVRTDVNPVMPSPYAHAGDPGAPVHITAYVTANCPLCKRLVGQVYQAVTNGPLTGKAVLTPKPFAAGIGDQALYAAHKFGKFWDFFLRLPNDGTRVDKRVIENIVTGLGLPPRAFIDAMKSPACLEKLHESYEEGKKFEVRATPTYLINGRRYRSFKDTPWIIDAVEYEYERMQAAKR